ncbi:acyl-CoA dehydrogenase family protein [Streptomyces iconiensis]|uniref:Acyl-CoA dehydrogenase family protein n=1 Tax=Streptomyces iconiensis TaxID=1384038 RepID=A0ABT6ZYE2_9ACTN|nr:acyl-CoA dehydrogenase family protein [Streptomyces iconiensis]MDJ1134090.1 acyl-CoA dehydrogenase family protein [Streptomyces iconiensis]
MDTAFTEEQDEIRRTVRELLARRCGPDDVKSAVRTGAGYDEELWRTLAGELGLPGLTLPEEYGGVGCGAAELALVFEEAGRALLPSPLLATAALAAPLIASLGTPAQRGALLPSLVSGERTAALAVPAGALPVALGLTGDAAEDAGWAGGGRAGGMQAYRDQQRPGGWRLYGECGQVLSGHSAGLLLVAAHAGGFARSRTLLFLVDAGSPGLGCVRQTALDETRAVARLELRDTPARLLGTDDERAASTAAALARLGPRVAAVLAAEAVGAADSALTRTVAYVKLREQFGRPIGSFQAVQHRLADVYVQVQAARSAAYYAAWAADAHVNAHEHADADADARARVRGDATAGGLALAQGLEALRLAAGEAVQLHGGVGFTWEHEAHLYFKRAAGDDLLFGPVHRLRAHAAERAVLFAPDAGADGHANGGRARREAGEHGGRETGEEAVTGNSREEAERDRKRQEAVRA